MNNENGWIGVDLDGTLATYDHWRGHEHIGEPIPKMVERVKQWISEGKSVKIFTARCYPLPEVVVGGYVEECRPPHIDGWDDAIMKVYYVREWCKKHIGHYLPITCRKGHGLIELWDDRAVGVIPNTGLRADGKP